MANKTLQDVYDHLLIKKIYSKKGLFDVVIKYCKECLDFSVDKLDDACDLFSRTCEGKLAKNTINGCVSNLRGSIVFCLEDGFLDPIEGFSITSSLKGKKRLITPSRKEKPKRNKTKAVKSIPHIQLYDDFTKTSFALLSLYGRMISPSSEEERLKSEKEFPILLAKFQGQCIEVEDAWKLLNQAKEHGQFVLRGLKWTPKAKDTLEKDGLGISLNQ